MRPLFPVCTHSTKTLDYYYYFLQIFWTKHHLLSLHTGSHYCWIRAVPGPDVFAVCVCECLNINCRPHWPSCLVIMLLSSSWVFQFPKTWPHPLPLTHTNTVQVCTYRLRGRVFVRVSGEKNARPQSENRTAEPSGIYTLYTEWYLSNLLTAQ